LGDASSDEQDTSMPARTKTNTGFGMDPFDRMEER